QPIWTLNSTPLDFLLVQNTIFPLAGAWTTMVTSINRILLFGRTRLFPSSLAYFSHSAVPVISPSNPISTRHFFRPIIEFSPRYICILETNGLEFGSEKALFDYYVELLSEVVGSHIDAVAAEKLKDKKIKCDNPTYSSFLLDFPVVRYVVEDKYFLAREKTTAVAESTNIFSPLNQNQRLLNIFSYYHFSKLNLEWDFDHWLINIKCPEGGFATWTEALECCIKVLAKALRSKKKAKEKIYVIWSIKPFGFGAEIDEKTAKKLKGLPDVLKVLPDCAFDAKEKDRGVIDVCSVWDEHLSLQFCYYDMSEKNNSENWLNGMHEAVGVKPELNIIDPYLTEHGQRSDCKCWFVKMEKPGGQFDSLQQRFELYIQTLSIVLGSEEEAKKKLYRVKCQKDFFGFGAEIDEEASNKLKGLSGVQAVCPDYVFIEGRKGLDGESGGPEDQKLVLTGVAVGDFVGGELGVKLVDHGQWEHPGGV
ncbi:hypothetical protein IFM89_011248, partial [Coptis chinensis]